MRLKVTLLAGVAISLFLAGCGGGSDNPYDGTWMLVYPALAKSSGTTTTCNNPPATIVIQNAAGTATLNASCSTTAASGVKATTTNYYAIVGVAITAKTDVASKDVFNAIANGVPFTGTCLSNSACSGVDSSGNTISINR